MKEFGSGERWESTVDDLGVVRWTAVTGSATLVRLRLTNHGNDPVDVQIVEEVPESVTDAVLITTTGDQTDGWRRIGDRIVHEFAVPAGQKRTTAYLLRSEDDPPVSLAPPDVTEVKRASSSSTTALDDVRGSRTNGATSPRDSTTAARPQPPDVLARLTPSSTEDERASEGTSRTRRRSSANGDEPTAEVDPIQSNEILSMNEYKLPRKAGEQPSTTENESIVDDLLDALEEDATPAQLRSLRSKLGASESERARIEYVQSRLGDLAAYIDALEALVDAHGIGVIDDLRDDIDENSSRAEALVAEIEDVEADVGRVSDETDESIRTLESEIDVRFDRVEERIASLESSITSTRSDLTSLEERLESDRLARAREVRRFDEALTENDDAIERLETRIDEFESFRRRFTNALTSSNHPANDAEAAAPVGSDSPSSD